MKKRTAHGKRWFFLSAILLVLMACSGGFAVPSISLKDQPTPTTTLWPSEVPVTQTPLEALPPQPSQEPAQTALPEPTRAPGAIPSKPKKTATTHATAAPLPTNLPATSLPDSSGATPTLGPDDWMNMPVYPTEVSEQVMLIYQMGLLKGNHPNAYSKVGDCNIILPYFMGAFDQPGAYQLGDYADLQGTIDYFAGSHGRKSMAAKPGMTAYSVLSMLWVDQKECKSSETPLTCEFRFNRPMFAILAFGTNDAKSQIDFEKALRRVIELSIGNGTVPILATKADNAEHDHSINRTIASLAHEYQLPLWNFWAATQSLPNQGLSLQEPDHLSAGRTDDLYFNFSGDNLQYGWTMRNLSALQMLDAVRKLIDARLSDTLPQEP